MGAFALVERGGVGSCLACCLAQARKEGPCALRARKGKQGRKEGAVVCCGDVAGALIEGAVGT